MTKLINTRQYNTEIGHDKLMNIGRHIIDIEQNKYDEH